MISMGVRLSDQETNWPPEIIVASFHTFIKGSLHSPLATSGYFSVGVTVGFRFVSLVLLCSDYFVNKYS